MIRWWRRLWAGLRRLLADLRGPKALSAGRDASDLPDDLQELYQRVRATGVVGDTSQRAILDYRHLRDVVMGPGATSDAIDDVSLLADAEELLRELLRRAPELQTLVELAGARAQDRKGREATGEAMLHFCDQAQVLHELTSAALRWASSQSTEDLVYMQRCAGALRE